eukprot:c45956_g1_i1 orf=3-182(-)
MTTEPAFSYIQLPSQSQETATIKDSQRETRLKPKGTLSPRQTQHQLKNPKGKQSEAAATK